MNKSTWWKNRRGDNMIYYRKASKLLRKWKTENGYTCKCVMHHRDDTEETYKYNEDHYERWGFNEDGSFEYGKYIMFMTKSEHDSYHNTGEKNSMYGKTHSEEARKKISDNNPWKGGHSNRLGCRLTAEQKELLSKRLSGCNNPNYGKHWTDEQKKERSEKTKGMHSGSDNPFYGKNHSDDSKRVMREAQQYRSQLFKKYKLNGGNLKWPEFLHAFKIGSITEKDIMN